MDGRFLKIPLPTEAQLDEQAAAENVWLKIWAHALENSPTEQQIHEALGGKGQLAPDRPVARRMTARRSPNDLMFDS